MKHTEIQKLKVFAYKVRNIQQSEQLMATGGGGRVFVTDLGFACMVITTILIVPMSQYQSERFTSVVSRLDTSLHSYLKINFPRGNTVNVII